MKSLCLLLGFSAGMLLGSQPSRAQFTGNYQTNIISGVTSNWVSNYYVGLDTFRDVLWIDNAGALSDGIGILGYYDSGSNNAAYVTGPGSVWVNATNLFVGYSGPGNQLVITNGGAVVTGASGYGLSIVGYNSSASNNSVLVAGGGSLWSNSTSLYIGYDGSGNGLVVSNGGRVTTHNNTSFGGYIGYDSGGSNNIVIVTDPGSVWSGDGAEDGMIVGNGGVGNRLMVWNGGQVSGRSGTVGWLSGSLNNQAVITGAGSIWSNSNTLLIGDAGSSNSLVISSGGKVIDPSATIGNSSSGTNNWVLVTDVGSVWSNANTLVVGYQNAGHSLVISKGGQVVDGNGGLGTGFGAGGSRSNQVIVTGPGSVWKNAGTLSLAGKGSANELLIDDGGQVISAYGIVGALNIPNRVSVANAGAWLCDVLTVGNEGSSNSVVIANGTLCATNVLVGSTAVACDNYVELDGGFIAVTNSTHDAVLEVRNGKLILNGGTLLVDRFVMTNTCAQFVRTGGSVIYGTAVLDPMRDDDGDGLANGYEQSHGLDPLKADADADADGDGMSNYQEYLAGTDPTNSASVFRITEIWPDDADMFLTWTAVGGKRYILQTATAFTGRLSDDFHDLNPAIVAPGTGETEVSVLHLGGATNGPSRFYRVRLVP